MNIRLYTSFILVFCFLRNPLFAHEGMWIPAKLSMVIADMHDAGLKLSAEEIYSINQSSIKDAIVHFGGGCTAEVISREGLILTNHHCGYSQIQSHSSVEQDYLKEGFWAATKGEELPNTGLTATFIVRMEDVTEAIKSAIAGLEGAEREAALRQKAGELIEKATEGTHYSAEIRPFFYGNEFYMIVKETFLDVRLVGAPPSSIGKFGYDADNWVWPRHTGDFALFRIYAASDNTPAPYSPDNRPYRPKHSLPINMKGLQPNDYTMVFGFPGTTEQYLTSHAVEYVLESLNPMRKNMRTASLNVIDAAMLRSDTIRIQYAAKQSRIANAHKKWIGQSMGLERFKALEMKRAQEAAFAAKAAGSPEATLPERLGSLYERFNEFDMAREYFIEFYFYGPEILRFAQGFSGFVEHYDSLSANKLVDAELNRLRSAARRHFKNYDAGVDRQIMTAMLPYYFGGCPEMMVPSEFRAIYEKNGGDAARAAEALYAKTIFADEAALLKLLEKPGSKLLKTLAKDPALRIGEAFIDAYRGEVSAGYAAFQAAEEALMADYVAATMRLFPDKRYSPDANSTLRLTYGKMEGSHPRDGMKYLPYTTLEGVAQKYIPGDRDFDVPERLLELHASRDYGPYATNGEMRVCFLGSHHTTGGNSGSPTLDANGYLVGLNFDRTWESTMSDIMFHPDICRNIMVDIKYILFIVDKFANAGHLVEEMELVY